MCRTGGRRCPGQGARRTRTAQARIDKLARKQQQLQYLADITGREGLQRQAQKAQETLDSVLERGRDEYIKYSSSHSGFQEFARSVGGTVGRQGVCSALSESIKARMNEGADSYEIHDPVYGGNAREMRSDNDRVVHRVGDRGCDVIVSGNNSETFCIGTTGAFIQCGTSEKKFLETTAVVENGQTVLRLHPTSKTLTDEEQRKAIEMAKRSLSTTKTFDKVEYCTDPVKPHSSSSQSPASYYDYRNESPTDPAQLFSNENHHGVIEHDAHHLLERRFHTIQSLRMEGMANDGIGKPKEASFEGITTIPGTKATFSHKGMSSTLHTPDGRNGDIFVFVGGGEPGARVEYRRDGVRCARIDNNFTLFVTGEDGKEKSMRAHYEFSRDKGDKDGVVRSRVRIASKNLTDQQKDDLRKVYKASLVIDEVTFV